MELRTRLRQLLESLQRVDSEGDARLTRLDTVLRSMNVAGVTVRSSLSLTRLAVSSRSAEASPLHTVS